MKVAVVKRLVLGALTVGVLLGGACVFEDQLRKLLPPDLEQRQARDRARETHVAAGASLSPGEELVQERAAAARLPASRAATGEEPVNLVLSASAMVSSEEDTTATLSVSQGPCPEGGVHVERALNAVETQRDAEGLALRMSRIACLSAKQGALYWVTPLQGRWVAQGADLPELESAVQRLEYTDAQGNRKFVTLLAAGYCETAEGPCAATIALEMNDPAIAPGLHLPLPQLGETALVLSAGD